MSRLPVSQQWNLRELWWPKSKLTFLKETLYVFTGIILMSGLTTFVENWTIQNKSKKNNLVILNCKITRKLKDSKHYPPC